MGWPALRTAHPGFFKVAVGILLLHLVLCLDTLVAPSVALKGPAFRAQADVAPLWLFAGAHGAAAALQMFGFYWKFTLARMAFLLSVTVFTLQGSIWMFAAVERKTSFAGGTLMLFVAVCAAASYREPEINPAVNMHALLSQINSPIGALVVEQTRPPER